MELKFKLKIFKDKGWKVNPLTGEIFNSRGESNKRTNNQGYVYCSTTHDRNKIRIKGHQLMWYLCYNEIPTIIDHINRIKNDNRISNLRLVTNQQNHFNLNTKGYTWNNIHKKWQSQITIDGKSIFLGRFDNEREAHKSYLEAKKIYHII